MAVFLFVFDCLGVLFFFRAKEEKNQKKKAKGGQPKRERQVQNAPVDRGRILRQMIANKIHCFGAFVRDAHLFSYRFSFASFLFSKRKEEEKRH
ncbi:MAG: hypothetical protein IJF24_02295 [Clostridia bacterium]|nr:hypothetical protein [Clostridia bacterium]